MELQGSIVTVRRQFGGHGPALGSSALLFVGVVFFPSFPHVGVVLIPSPTIDGTKLGNVFGGGGMLQRENF